MLFMFLTTIDVLYQNADESHLYFSTTTIQSSLYFALLTSFFSQALLEAVETRDEAKVNALLQSQDVDVSIKKEVIKKSEYIVVPTFLPIKFVTSSLLPFFDIIMYLMLFPIY
jgi:hypothetical protein